MNLNIIKILSSLIRYYWETDYRETIDSLKIEMRKTEDLDTFFKRLNSIGDERSILRILNNILMDDNFQRDCNRGWQIYFRPVDDIRSNLIILLQDDGFKIENGRVRLPPFSTGLQLEKYVRNILEKLNYEIIEQPKSVDIQPDFLITTKTDPEKKLIVEVKHYENSLVPETIVNQTLEYMNKLNADKGIIVTTTGFSEQAKKLSALNNKIEILTLKELINRIPASEKDAYLEDLVNSGLLGKSETELTQKQEESGLKKKKEDIAEKYERAITTTDPNTKGTLLEEVIVEILKLVPDLEIIDTRVNNGREEIDIQVRNFNRKKIWADFESVIFVECKNWSNPVGSDEIRNFVGKLNSNGLSIGILVATSDITGGLLDGSRGEIKNLLSHGKKIVVLNGDDIKEILRCTDVSDKIDDKFTELFK